MSTNIVKYEENVTINWKGKKKNTIVIFTAIRLGGVFTYFNITVWKKFKLGKKLIHVNKKGKIIKK